MTKKQRVLVAGVPRSGSTWCFNAVRFLLLQSGADVHSAWCEDYEAENSADWHLVKAHRPEQVFFEPSFVVTSYRDICECLASRVRMGWLKEEPVSLMEAAKAQSELYRYWKARSDFEVFYENILNYPEVVVAQLARALCLDSVSAQQTAAKLNDLEAPEEGKYSAITLLHPNHRSEGARTADKAAEIRALLIDASDDLTDSVFVAELSGIKPA